MTKFLCLASLLLTPLCAEAKVDQHAAGRCCDTCTLPLVKYYSVDVAHGFCGNACMDPKKFSIYKKFEANLTLVDAGHPDCSGQFSPDGKFYTQYDSTVTHGDPFGILAVTLDLYAPTGMPDHSCCSTPLNVPVVGPINCKGKPKNLTIRGTGPYCCPATSTEEAPCPKDVYYDKPPCLWDEEKLDFPPSSGQPGGQLCAPACGSDGMTCPMDKPANTKATPECVHYVGHEKLCVLACSSSSDCPSGAICKTLGVARGACAFPYNGTKQWKMVAEEQEDDIVV